jgi:simple sugar transport system permease protein
MEQIITGIIASTITAGAVIIIIGIAELLAENTGVQNLGLDGMVSIGAVTAIIVVNKGVPNPWIGLIGAMLAGLLLSLIFSFASIWIKADQFLVGLALTFVGVGVAGQIGKSYVGKVSPARFSPIEVPLLSKIPVIGEALFNHTILVYLAYLALPAAAYYILYKTRHGLNIRAAGQNPSASDACGVPVDRLRFIYTCINGMLCGASGAYLTLSLSPSWADGVVAGRGWIALTLVIFANWNPITIIFGALLFGAATSLGFVVQVQGWPIPSSVLFSLPYVATIVMIWISTLIQRRRRSDRLGIGPAMLGLPFHRE